MSRDEWLKSAIAQTEKHIAETEEEDRWDRAFGDDWDQARASDSTEELKDARRTLEALHAELRGFKPLPAPKTGH